LIVVGFVYCLIISLRCYLLGGVLGFLIVCLDAFVLWWGCVGNVCVSVVLERLLTIIGFDDAISRINMYKYITLQS